MNINQLILSKGSNTIDIIINLQLGLLRLKNFSNTLIKIEI